LGSGTSGGTLAPLLTIGGAFGLLLGTAVQYIFPSAAINLPTCALIGMASMFAGASRALLTSIVFAFETTMQPHGVLPLLGACVAAYFVSFFLMKHGTIMTEKINRRGVHTPDAFEPDILQRVNAEAVMEDDFEVLSAENTVEEVKQWITETPADKLNEVIAVVDTNEDLIGTVRLDRINQSSLPGDTPVSSFIQKQNIYVYNDSQLSFAVDVMDRFSRDYLPVIDRNNKKKVVGILTHKNIFAAYRKRRSEENTYIRNISLRRSSYRLIVRGKQLLQS
jgi:predicted transcriptional regulator